MKTQDPGNMGQDPIPPEQWVKPVQIVYLLPLSSNRQVTLPKSLLAQELKSCECLISRTFKTRSSGSGMSEFSGFSSVNDIPPPQVKLPLPVRSDGESTDETISRDFVSTEKSVKQSGGTGHLEKSGKSIQSDELGRPVIPGYLAKLYNWLYLDIGLVPDSPVYPYTLANPDRLTNPDSRFLSDSQLNPDIQK